MEQYRILKKIEEVGIVAVVRGDSIKEAIRISKACIKGGLPIIEVTYTVPGATQIIEELRNDNNILVGAGTILDVFTARIAILAGAKFIVSPGFDKTIAKLCNLYQVPYIPGCMSITEITKALQYGVNIIKLFPGSAFNPTFIKAIKAPLPQVNIMPTGGVNLENIEEWLKNGVIAVGVGGKLTEGSTEEIISTAQKFLKKIEISRNK